MSDWLDRLSPGDLAEWEKMVEYAREVTAEKISGSACVISMVTEPLDVKFALELGMAIVLDKPIIAVAMKGTAVPAKLRKVADEVVELPGDLGDPTAAAGLTAAIKRITDRLDREEP